ncbi:MAG TPA: hypothetical protein VFN76_00180 [Candidatus Limnocylindria bacterium]|nr:hypothetical protein [Candidatus Limnocylindria bacterium]
MKLPDLASVDRGRVLGWVLDVIMRLAVIGFAIEAVMAGPDDPRFAGKGIAMRDLILAGGVATLIVPILHFFRRRWDRYPVWTDVAFLSILALDMAGNSLNLYEQPWRFDLIPHAYGPAAGLLGLLLLGVQTWVGLAVINGIHVLLEIQEVLGDVVFGTSNVNGAWDSITDLAAGLTASVLVALAWEWFHARKGRRERRRSYSEAR